MNKIDNIDISKAKDEITAKHGFNAYRNKGFDEGVEFALKHLNQVENHVVLGDVIKCDCCNKDITNESKLCMKCANEGFE